MLQVRKKLGLAEPSKDDMDEALIRLIKAEMAGDTPHEADAELVRDLQAEHQGRAPPPIPAELYKVLPDTPRELKGGIPMTMLAGALQSSLKGDLCAPRPRAVPKKQETVPLKSYMEKGFEDGENAPGAGCTRMRCVNNSIVYQLDKDELEELFEAAIEDVNDGSTWSHTSQSAMCRAVQVFCAAATSAAATNTAATSTAAHQYCSHQYNNANQDARCCNMLQPCK